MNYLWRAVTQELPYRQVRVLFDHRMQECICNPKPWIVACNRVHDRIDKFVELTIRVKGTFLTGQSFHGLMNEAPSPPIERLLILSLTRRAENTLKGKFLSLD